MSDTTALLLVLAALHLMEGCQVVPHGTVVFRPSWWRGYHAQRAGSLLRVNRGRLVVHHPLDPRSHVFVAGLPHIALTSAGVCDVAPEADNTPTRRPFVPWARVGAARAHEACVVCEGLGALPCGSPAAARVWARVLNAVRTADPNRRETLIERWQRMRFSPELARRRLDRVRRATRALERVSTVAFAAVLGGAVVVAQRQSTGLLTGFLGLGVLAGLAIAGCFARSHARLERRDWPERLGRALLLAACFPVAFRARSGLARNALAIVHPAAIAAVLLPPRAAAETLTEMRRLCIHPAPAPATATPDAEALGKATTGIVREIDRIAAACHLSLPAHANGPRLDDPTIRSWCPRCHGTFVHPEGQCSTCPGVALVRVNSTER